MILTILEKRLVGKLGELTERPRMTRLECVRKQYPTQNIGISLSQRQIKMKRNDDCYSSTHRRGRHIGLPLRMTVNCLLLTVY